MAANQQQGLREFRKNFPAGTKLKIIEVQDPFLNIPIGEIANVHHVDDLGRIYVSLRRSHRIFTLDLNQDKVLVCGK